jgi:hypothetical protein
MLRVRLLRSFASRVNYSVDVQKGLYERLKDVSGKGLTYAEKILYAHGGRGDGYLTLNPDRVAMQDASAQVHF